ncbi:hypothetical protein, partial [Streptomyces europaeiscabiei]
MAVVSGPACVPPDPVDARWTPTSAGPAGVGALPELGPVLPGPVAVPAGSAVVRLESAGVRPESVAARW